jgi:hypothetical protein
LTTGAEAAALAEDAAELEPPAALELPPALALPAALDAAELEPALAAEEADEAELELEAETVKVLKNKTLETTSVATAPRFNQDVAMFFAVFINVCMALVH